MFGRILLLCLFWGCVSGARAEGPSEFYNVSHFDSDLEGAWEYRILDVSRDGLDSVVRYIRIAPVRVSCPRRISVRAAEVRLPGISPAQLMADQNPCDGTSRRDRARGPGYARFAIGHAAFVAKCGSEERLATLTRLGEGDLQRIIDRAFGSEEIFWGISEEEDLKPQRQGDELIPGIAAGRFDKGLNAAFRDEALRKPLCIRDLLADYAGVVKASEFMARRLVTTNDYRFTKYVEPSYPSLGIAALVEGTVDLRLRLDSSTGEVRNVVATGGQAELVERARRAAQDWQFAPQSINSESITVAVEFRFQCP